MPLPTRFEHGADGIIHADELVILPDNLSQPALVLGKQRVVLHQIEQTRRLAEPAQHHLK